MLAKFKFFCAGCMILLLAGCGQTVKHSIEPTPNAPFNAIGQGKTIVIMPLVDYSEADYRSALHRGVIVSEAVMDKLSFHGFSFPVEEDVVRYLVAKEMVALPKKEEKKEEKKELSSFEKSLTYENWSPEFLGYIQEKVQIGPNDTVETDSSESTLETESSDSTLERDLNVIAQHGVTTEQIIDLGQQFSADYILRGRIVEFKDRQDQNFMPIQDGIFRPIGNVLIRPFTGRIGGEGKEWDPFDTHRRTANVEIRLYVQDAATGETIWSNHASIEAAPESFYADAQEDIQYRAALQHNACILIQSFATSMAQQ